MSSEEEEDRIVKVPDGNGHTITTKDVDGLYNLPPFPRLTTRMHNLKNFQARETDVVVCAFLKCGTHWLWEVVSMILHGGEARLSDEPKEHYFLEMVDISALDKSPSPRVLNTHLPVDWIPPEIFKKKCKIVKIFRNPKDAYTSLYYHLKGLATREYTGTWDGYFELMMKMESKPGVRDYTNWFEFAHEWWKYSKTDSSVLTIMYEEMKRDPVSHVQKISDFLGQPLDQDVCMKIAKECRFESMQAKKHDFLEKFIESSDKNIWRKGATGMYRKGAVGDWKNHFTVSQNERFEALIRECMKDCDMQLTYE